MTMQEYKIWKENKRKENKAKWDAEILEHGNCRPLTDKEYNKIYGGSTLKPTTKHKTRTSRNNGYYKPTFADRIKLNK